MKKYTLTIEEDENGKIVYNIKNEGFRKTDIIGILEVVKIYTATEIHCVDIEREVSE